MSESNEPNKWDDVRELCWEHAPYLMADLTLEGPERLPVSDEAFERILVRLLKKAQMYNRMEKGDMT
jgi:hypothetical protein